MKKASKKRHFKHLNQHDRDRIELLLKDGHTQKDIAHILNVSESCISRERKRLRRNGYYSSETAQHKAGVKRSNSKYQGMKIQKNNDLRKRIIELLKERRSPDEISGRLKVEGYTPTIGTKAIYKWLYSVLGQPYCKYLCTKRYKRKTQKRTPKRQMIPDKTPLEKRPKETMDGEGDLFVSSHNTVSGAVIVVPKTQLIIGQLIPNRKPSTMVGSVNRMIKNVAIDDLTWDNGIENKNHKEFNLPSFFCDPHSPWQKPHVENNIGLLRRWFIPKKSDLATIEEEQLQRHLNYLNHKWRKSLGYRSAYEVSLEYGIIQKIPPRVEGDV